MAPCFEVFEGIRKMQWGTLILAIIAASSASLLVAVLAAQPAVREALAAIERGTGGMIQAPLLAGPVYFTIVGAAIFGVGRLRSADVGWRWSAVGPALLVTPAFWLVMQLGLMLWILVSDEPLRWNEAWSRLGTGWFAGQLLAQLLGNALLEEMVFRGFLLPQFFLKASAHVRPVTALALALLASQVIFALSHIPHRLLVLNWPMDRLFADQLELLVQGFTYSAVYLVTGNIFICVGLHSLWNQPARLLPVPLSPGVKIVWYATVLILLGICLIARGYRNRAAPVDTRPTHRVTE